MDPFAYNTPQSPQAMKPAQPVGLLGDGAGRAVRERHCPGPLLAAWQLVGNGKVELAFLFRVEGAWGLFLPCGCVYYYGGMRELHNLS